MPKAKPLGKEMILAAMNKTKSNRAAARYLNVSYQHYKKWAKQYDATEEGYKTLFDQHLNQSGKGIPKFLNNGKKDFALIDIIEGRLSPASFNPKKIKYRLIEEGYLKEECGNCGFHERRVSDYKIPLILNFKDRNKQHYRLENLEMLCYNCFFLFQGDIYDEKQLEALEDHKPLNSSKSDWELDDYQKQRLAELFGDKEDDDGLDIISRL